MERELDAWLKTYRNEDSIAPVDWETLPDEAVTKLDDFARDEAVRRADHFAKEGYLDLNRQDSIRQFVESMARVWRLPGARVRTIVEEILDDLPPLPGREFEKLATRLFRRRKQAQWSTLLEEIEPREEAEVVQAALEAVRVPGESRFNREEFREVLSTTYDHWTLSNPKEAVAEFLDVLQRPAENRIRLEDTMEIARLRGANSVAKALRLELEVGVEEADPDELARILKRYALIVRRGGELEDAPREEAPQETAPPPSDKPPAGEEAAAPREATPQKPRLAEGGKEEREAETVPPTEEASAAVSNRGEPEGDYQAPTAEDEEAVAEMFGQGVEGEEAPPEGETAGRAASNGPAPQPPSTGEEEAPQPAAMAETGEGGTDAQERREAEPSQSEGTASEEMEQRASVEDEPAGSEGESAGEPEAEREREERPAEPEPAEPEEGTDEAEPAAAAETGGSDRSARDGKPPRSKGLKGAFSPGGPVERKDRFADLREGKLREWIVQEMYDGDETMLDVFLAKLSGAPDWNRAKQFIANEFFRCDLDLHSELGEEFFAVLKRSLHHNR